MQAGCHYKMFQHTWGPEMEAGPPEGVAFHLHELLDFCPIPGKFRHDLTPRTVGNVPPCGSPRTLNSVAKFPRDPPPQASSSTPAPHPSPQTTWKRKAASLGSTLILGTFIDYNFGGQARIRNRGQEYPGADVGHAEGRASSWTLTPGVVQGERV